MSLDPLLLDVLACPVDKGPLLWFEDEDVLYNPRLQKSYAVVDGVPVLLVDEAVTVGERRARAADGQGRDQQGAGHGPGVWVSERAPPRHARDVGGHGRPARAAVRGAADGRRGVRADAPAAAAPSRCRGVRPGHRGTACAAAAALTAPDLPVPSGSAAGPRVPAFVGPTHWSSRSRPRAAPRDADGGREGGRTRGARWWPSAASPGGAGPPGRRRRVCPGARSAPAPVRRPRAPRWGRRPSAARRAGPGRAAARLRADGDGGGDGRWPAGATRWSRRAAARPSGPPDRPDHPAGLRRGRRGRGGRALVEDPGQPERQGAGVRRDGAGADPRRAGRVGSGRGRHPADDVAGAAAPRGRGTAHVAAGSTPCRRRRTKWWPTSSRSGARATTT